MNLRFSNKSVQIKPLKVEKFFFLKINDKNSSKFNKRLHSIWLAETISWNIHKTYNTKNYSSFKIKTLINKELFPLDRFEMNGL
jgi:hypothetical protein